MFRFRYFIFFMMIFVFGTGAQAQRQVKKVHYLDKFPVSFEKWDSTAYVFADSVKSYNWQVYFDANLTHKMADFYLIGDTTYQINYYHSGRKKKEIRCINFHEMVYHAEWCINGTLKFENYDFVMRYHTFLKYYCNGQLKSEDNLYSGGEPWGVSKGWYENGKQSYEIVYPDFDEFAYHSGLLKWRKLSEVQWDSTGLEIKRIDYD